MADGSSLTKVRSPARTKATSPKAPMVKYEIPHGTSFTKSKSRSRLKHINTKANMIKSEVDDSPGSTRARSPSKSNAVNTKVPTSKYEADDSLGVIKVESPLEMEAITTKAPPAKHRMDDGPGLVNVESSSGLEAINTKAPTANMVTLPSPRKTNGQDEKSQLQIPTETVPLGFATAAESGVEDQPVPTTASSIVSFGFLKSCTSIKWFQVIANCTQQMSRRQRSIKPEEQQAIFNILKSFNSLGAFSEELNLALRIRSLLSSILGETAISVGPYEYPEPLQRNASILLNRLDAEMAAEDEQSKTSPKPESERASKKRRTSRAQPTSYELSREDKKTFKHIMRGILISGESRRAYILDRNYRPAPRNCNVVGHNGLKVGDWWPLRVCALRDGAHGAMQAGIAGSSQTGAYSIVVSNTYAELDLDHGRTLYYSGSNSHSNTNPLAPQISFATRAMRISLQQRFPVRVIRSSNPESVHAPSKGLRYDGLYMIESEGVERNGKGGAYARFKLVRCEGQGDVDVARPDAREGKVVGLLREGVGW